MMSRRVRLQLLGLALIAVLGVGFVGVRYANLGSLLGATTYPVTVQLADSGGIFTGADVTYRGVSVGRVGPLTLTANGVDVQLDIDKGAPAIPADTSAAVRNLSAIGEQYVDLQPAGDGGKMLTGGSVIPVSRTTVPVSVEDLIVSLDDFVRTVPLDSLRTVVDQLGTAFANTAQPLQRLLDTSNEFTKAAQAALPQTTALLRDGRTVLTTQNDTAGQFKDFSRSLAQLAAQLKTSDPDLRAVIDNGPEAGRQISGLLDESGSGLGDVISNLLVVSTIAQPRQANLSQILTAYPGIAANAATVVPGDGTAHLGLVLNVFDPYPCTKGYEGTTRRSGADVADTPANANAYCAEPPGSPIDVRGAQNAPNAATPKAAPGTRSSGSAPVPYGSESTAVNSAPPLSSLAQILLP